MCSMEIYESPIEDPVQLREACAQISGCSYVAVDTEFTRIRTYRSKLQLIQLATDDFIFCVDTVLCPDLSPVLQLINSSSATMIFHSAGQDLDVLHDYDTLPKRIFDTQIAAWICGYEELSFKSLVYEIVGLSLDKNMTRSNWQKRPFSQEQIRYALDDVRYLLPVYTNLDSNLRKINRKKWLEEECVCLLDASHVSSESDKVLKSFLQGGNLAVVDQYRAKEILIWREERARSIDLPRQWVMTDKQILQIVQDKPRTSGELANALAIKHGKARNWMREVFSILQSLPNDIATPVWQPQEPLTARQKELSNHILRELKKVALKNHIPVEMICTRKEVNSMVRGSRNSRLFSGWRKEITEDVITPLLLEYRHLMNS